MAVMISEVYDALREVGVSEEKSRRAAEAVAVQEPRLTAIETRLTGVETRLGTVEGRLTVVETRLTAVEGHLTAVKSRLDFMQWQIGIVAALQIATLVKLFVY
jgi:hypothetical protein